MKLKTIIKFIILVAIFYAFLAFNVFHIGEKMVPNSKNYLTEDIPTEDMEIEDNYFETTVIPSTTGHFAATENRYDVMLKNLCKTVNICDKISFIGTYAIYDKYSYTKAITTLVSFIDTN